MKLNPKDVMIIGLIIAIIVEIILFSFMLFDNEAVHRCEVIEAKMEILLKFKPNDEQVQEVYEEFKTLCYR